MKNRNNGYFGFLLFTVVALCCLALVAGCSKDDATGIDDRDPNPQMAASLAQSSKTAAMVKENLAQLDLFRNPMNSIAGEAGLYEEIGLDGWTGGGVSFPENSARIAAGVRSLNVMNKRSVIVAVKQSPAVLRFAASSGRPGPALVPGDTISVEYFEGPDSTGLNALIEGDQPNMVRFVSLREYPRILGHVVRRDQEIVIDTGGTLEDDNDDQYYSVECEEEMFGGQVTISSLAPVSGSGPMLDGVLVLAHQRVTDPRFHLLQKWTETNIKANLGDFRVEGDEEIHTISAAVHWRNDAEHRAYLSVPGGGVIGADNVARALGEFDAAPADRWLESIVDTLLVRIGDLDEESDDLLIEVSRRAVFDGTAFDGGQPRHYVHFLPETPVSPGEEPCGGEAQQDVWYPQSWWLVHLQREADVDCDGSGTLHELLEMRDGSSFERTITWDGSGNATVNENRFNGTVVSGSFNESSGEYSVQTTYPMGHDPVSRDQHGQILEGDIEAWDIFVWQDSHADTTYFDAEGDESNFTIVGYTVRGSMREDFTLSGDGNENLSGSWSRSDGARGDFSVEALEGGGAHLVFSAEDPAAEGSPSVTGEVWLAPDGSGTGTVTITQYGNTATFEITFGPDGTADLVDGSGNPISL